MSITFTDRGAFIALALLLIGCSGGDNDQPVETAAALAAPQAAVTALSPVRAPATTAPTIADAAVPDMPASAPTPAAASSVQGAAEGTNVPATLEPAQHPTAQTNQSNQAGPARQWGAAMEPTATDVVPQPVPQGAPQPGVTTPTVPMHGAQIVNTYDIQPHHAPIGPAAQLAHHTPPLSPQIVTTETADATTPPSAQAVAAIKRARFIRLASRFNSPIMLRAQDTQAGPPTMMMLKMGNVGISNFDDTARVNFAIQIPDKDWVNEYVDPRDSREFGCGFSGECLFWMQTGDNAPVFYKMQHDHRYAIFWDTQAGIWDLRLVAQGP